ncbi:DUF2849 domain-containing protein [Maribius pontilimi]|uniref:DUF2849 domain-containing protein n=1 Tax=Palleronia pontilimi TaxID=1964209 RepID=A0A934ID18_9RHOB|nr:DUF2849 domain-containing protein [Palleronia pontilimi]MBJ3762217.1 DUF2849 domain-containing protein [Palleronia pontilimi]
MSREYTPKVITANHLMLGDAIWLTEDDTWSRDIARAELLTDEAHADMRMLFAKGQPQIAVGPYLAEAEQGALGPVPVHLREVFRTRGPSNRDHGKQVDGAI